MIEGTQKQETELHRRFAETHLRGEWFFIDGDLKKFLSSLPPADEQYSSVGSIKALRSPYADGQDRGRPRKLSKKTVEEMREMVRTEGKTVEYVAAHFNVHPGTVTNYLGATVPLREREVKLGRKSALTHKQWLEVEKDLLNRADLTVKAIADKHGIHPSSVQNQFPRWRSRTVRDRKAHRAKHPLPE